MSMSSKSKHWPVYKVLKCWFFPLVLVFLILALDILPRTSTSPSSIVSPGQWVLSKFNTTSGVTEPSQVEGEDLDSGVDQESVEETGKVDIGSVLTKGSSDSAKSGGEGNESSDFDQGDADDITVANNVYFKSPAGNSTVSDDAPLEQVQILEAAEEEGIQVTKPPLQKLDRQVQWLFETTKDCDRSQGCGLLLEATKFYSNRDVSPPSVVYRGAPWRGHVGSWLAKCDSRAVPVHLPEVRYGKRCPQNCRAHGTCNAELGVCRCSSGWKGDGCEEDDFYPCNRQPIPNYPKGTWIYSICAATCDLRTSNCICGPKTKYPGRSAGPPHGFVYRNLSESLENPDPALINGKSPTHPGWCEADVAAVESGEQQVVLAGHCMYDGWAGTLCQIPVEQFCPNQCSLQGTCLQGFCKCHPDWYGVDCSIPSDHAKTQLANTRWPPKPLGQSGPFPPADSALGQVTDGNDAATDEGKGGSGVAAQVQRKRPLIYVYDLPPDFNAHQLQRRHGRGICTPRGYSHDNSTEWQPYLYSADVLVFEHFLRSEHRTTNAEEADFFYVPILGTCIHQRADDSPRYQMTDFLALRPYLVAHHYKLAYEYISKTFPYWNRNNGRNHIWANFWDEGACAVPKEIWNSIMLVHWGNTAKYPKSTTAYGADGWYQIPRDFTLGHPCYDPAKDVVLPAFKLPTSHLLEQKLVKRPYKERNLLFYFNGNLGPAYDPGRPEKKYSWGIRQTVGRYFSTLPNRDGKVGLNASEDVHVTHVRTHNYEESLASARFCGVFPGDGWSGRMEDAVLAGCIPVIIQDGIHLTFENMLDFREFAVRISEADIPNMVKILRAIPEEEVRAKLRAVKKLWPRFMYKAGFIAEVERQKALGRDPGWWEQLGTLLNDEDALATLMQILHYRLHNDPWRQELKEGPLVHKRESGLPDGCSNNS